MPNSMGNFTLCSQTCWLVGYVDGCFLYLAPVPSFIYQHLFMRFIILTLLLIVSHSPIDAQTLLELLTANKSRSELTFKDYQHAFYSYWSPFNVIDGYYESNGTKIKAAGYKQFKRWEWLQEQRVNHVTGEFPTKSAYQIVQEHQKQFPLRMDPPVATWVSLGPSSSDANSKGVGRINTIGFHPQDPNTYWAGSPSGGFWVTYDDGNTWKCLTDHLESLGVSDVVVGKDFLQNNTLYIATGDRDSYDNLSIVVLESTDGSTTWNTTAICLDMDERH